MSIKQLIYLYFKSKNKKGGAKKNKINFGPSYLTKCGRQIYYNKTQTPESNPTPIHTYIKFAMGNSVHESIQAIFQKIGIWVEGEDFKEINYEGLNWIYRIDGLVEIDGIKSLIEIKSVYATGYNSVEREPKKDHITQLIMYMLFEKIEKGHLLYIGRDNGYMVEYTIENGKIWKNEGDNKIFIYDYPEIDYNRLHQIKKDIENKILPKKDYTIYLKNMGDRTSTEFTKDKKKYKTNWQCSYCNWKDLCWGNELKEIKNHKFYIDGEFID